MNYILEMRSISYLHSTIRTLKIINCKNIYSGEYFQPIESTPTARTHFDKNCSLILRSTHASDVLYRVLGVVMRTLL
jgi:hypothetical protein